jgi:hypothetical protein
MVREVGIQAGDRLAARQVLGLEGVSIGRENEFGLGSGGRRAGPERRKPLRDLAECGDGNMDVVGLKDAAYVGLVRLALAQTLEGGLFVAEGLEEGEGELCRVERMFGESRDSFLDLNGVHAMEAPLERVDRCSWAGIAHLGLIFSSSSSAMPHFTGMRQLLSACTAFRGRVCPGHPRL